MSGRCVVQRAYARGALPLPESQLGISNKMGASRDPKDRSEMPEAAAPLPNELQGQIGKKLREAYSELVAEPVPDRFIQLLQQLKDKEGNGKGGAL